MYLTHLLFHISLEQTISIVTDRGEVVGHIDVLLELCEEDDEEVNLFQFTKVAIFSGLNTHFLFYRLKTSELQL